MYLLAKMKKSEVYNVGEDVGKLLSDTTGGPRNRSKLWGGSLQ